VNIDWVIPCRYVEVHDNLATIVGAGIDTFWVAAFPAQLQVMMAVRLTATPEELEEASEHEVRNVLRGPGGDVLSEVAGTIAIGGQGEIRQDWLQGVMLATMAAVDAAEPGAYTFEHHVDQSSASVPLHVVLGPPPGLEQP
jgi:hypothetical protein